MNILGRITKIPGGIMLVPMAVTALINTFAPSLIRIGGPTTACFTSAGTMTVIGMMLFVSGSQVKFSQLKMAFARGGVLVAVRMAIGFAASWISIKYFGYDGFWGISTLSLVVVLSSCNPGVYMGLMQSYGDNIDKAALGVLNVIAVPAIPLLILDITGGGGFDYMIAVSTVSPFFVGMLLGNLDPKIQGLFATSTPLVLVFLGFCFGSVVNLYALLNAGFADVVILGLVLFVSIPIMLLADRVILRRPGYASVAISSIGGVSVSAPTIIANVLPQYQPYVAAATAQVALAVILTAIVVPFLTKVVAEKFGGSSVTSASAVSNNPSSAG